MDEIVAPAPENAKTPEKSGGSNDLAEGVGFEPTVRLPVRLISSQVPLTTQPPFRTPAESHSAQVSSAGKLIRYQVNHMNSRSEGVFTGNNLGILTADNTFAKLTIIIRNGL